MLLNTMNIELTTNCPLHCPQCYCSLTGGKNIDLNTAVFWIKEGAAAGVKEVMLSGGESLCYPHIYDVVSAAKKYCGGANVALSGVGFTQSVYDKLIKAGVTGIYISLNGSTAEINSLSRDGYEYAIKALKLLCDNNYNNTTINWVMHSSNADDFLNVLHIAEKYNVANLTVMALKPDSMHTLKTLPSKEQMISIKQIINTYKGNTKIYVESCFSPMLALVCDTKLFGNLNVGVKKGCAAARTTFSVNVDGLLSPCRHLDYFEEFNSLEEYWEESVILKKIREINNSIPEEPCSSCKYCNYCDHCLAINDKVEKRLFRGNKYCPVK